MSLPLLSVRVAHESDGDPHARRRVQLGRREVEEPEVAAAVGAQRHRLLEAEALDGDGEDAEVDGDGAGRDRG